MTADPRTTDEIADVLVGKWLDTPHASLAELKFAISAALTSERKREREACAKVADDEAGASIELRNMARADKDGTGALVHAAEAETARLIAKAIRGRKP